MMRKFTGLLIIVFAMLAFENAAAEPLSIDLADDQVNIDSVFTGSHLVLFGTRNQRGEVIVVLEGPRIDLKVREKKRVFGAWVNRASKVFKDTPSYYDYALSVESEAELLNEDLLREKRIGLTGLKAVFRNGEKDKKSGKAFRDALIRNKQVQDFYPAKPHSVQFMSENLFRVDFYLPANVPSGEYTVRGLLVNDGQVVYEQSKNLRVGLTGFNANVYQFSHDYSFLYGILCVFLACMAGWLSNAIARRN